MNWNESLALQRTGEDNEDLNRLAERNARNATEGIAAKRAKAARSATSKVPAIGAPSQEERVQKEHERVAILNECISQTDHPAVRKILLLARDRGYELRDCYDSIKQIYAEENNHIELLKRISNPNRDKAVEALSDPDPAVAMLARMVINARKEEKKDDGKTSPEAGETGANDPQGPDPDPDVETLKRMLKKKK